MSGVCPYANSHREMAADMFYRERWQNNKGGYKFTYDDENRQHLQRMFRETISLFPITDGPYDDAPYFEFIVGVDADRGVFFVGRTQFDISLILVR